MIGHDSQGAYSDASCDQLLDSPESAIEQRRSLSVVVARSARTPSRRSLDAQAAGGDRFPPVVDGQRGWTNPDRLTPRETEVVRWMAQGLSNAGIARRLFVSTKTVELHVARIFDKFGLHQQSGTNRRVLAVIRWLNQEG